MTLRLFVDTPLCEGLDLPLPPGPARHAQVRRVQPGDGLTLFDGRGGEWPALVTHMGRSEVRVRVAGWVDVDREPLLQVTLAVGMPANERMDALVEKATELGVATIQPLVCERSVLRLAGERAERKREHWHGVAVAASEQCGRTRVPQVAPVLDLPRWLEQLGRPTGDAAADAADAPAAPAAPAAPDAAYSGGGERWLLSPGGAPSALQRPTAAAQGRLLALSGPEGGLSLAEEALAGRHGFRAVSLGRRVLRADTAPLALLAWLVLPG